MELIQVYVFSKSVALLIGMRGNFAKLIYCRCNKPSWSGGRLSNDGCPIQAGILMSMIFFFFPTIGYTNVRELSFLPFLINVLGIF